MKDLQMPHSYAAIPEQEQYSLSGGGPLTDALGAFSTICVWTISSSAGGCSLSRSPLYPCCCST